MKTLRFLLLSLIMVAFLAPNVVNAQATVDVYPDEFGIHYEVDGLLIDAWVVGKWQEVITPIKEFDDNIARIPIIIKIFRGVIVNDVPFPESTLKQEVYGKLRTSYTILITPTGEVTCVKISKSKIDLLK